MDKGDEGNLMATLIDVEVRGLLELQRKMEQMVADLHGTPVLNATRDSTLMVQRSAKENISRPYPAGAVDTGTLRASIVPEIVAGAEQIWGIVGSNIRYAPYIEYGTRPHWPPFIPILTWVRRKNIAGVYSVKTRRRLGSQSQKDIEDMTAAWFITLKIAKHGTKAHPYLIPAFQQNEDKIRKSFDHAIEVIVNK